MDDSIPISALQHYAFCPRQCGYIHLERVWQDNQFTAQGNQLHDRVHSSETETRGNMRTERGVSVQSLQYGIHGQLDLLEIQFKPYILTPVEYKRGKPKVSDIDRIQLCAQALCLEEMQSITIERAAIWYWQKRKREWVDIDDDLRAVAIATIDKTKEMFYEQSLPAAKYFNGCKSCSFVAQCNPKVADKSLRYIDQLFDV